MPEIPRQQAADKRRAREQRIRDLRRRVVAVAVALFVAAWGGLYIQLVSGHDPALASETAPVTQAADPEAVTDDGWSDSSTDGAWSDSSDSTQSASAEPAAVTTGQS